MAIHVSLGMNTSVTMNDNDVSDTYVLKTKTKGRHSDMSEGDVVIKRKGSYVFKIGAVILSIIILSGVGGLGFSLGAKSAQGQGVLVISQDL